MFRFGDFELNLDRYELHRGGDAVKAEPRVLEVLNYLIERRDRVVPKEELLDKLWADVHVSDSALTTAIRDARRALGDSPTDPRWIRTIYGRGFRFVGHVMSDAAADTKPAAAPAPAPTASSGQSIAVLPFTDLSPAHDLRHFCDGIAEELINTLTRIHDLRVVSRATAFDFREDDDVRVLGTKLGVRHVLRGSVRKSDDRLRITVHLVDTRRGHHLWSEKYDRQVGDIFSLQEEIAEKTVRALLGVMVEGALHTPHSTPVRIDAYEFHLRGRTHLLEATPESFDAAVGMFELAIDFDAEYAPAHAGLADALGELSVIRNDPSLLRRAAAAAERAIELAPGLAEVHISRGHIYMASEKYEDAARELELAISINPRSAEAHYRLGHLRVREAKLEEAAEMFERASSLEPADFRPPLQLVWINRTLGRDAESREAEARTAALRAIRAR